MKKEPRKELNTLSKLNVHPSYYVLVYVVEIFSLLLKTAIIFETFSH